MSNIIGVASMTLRDLSDAVISGSQPKDPSEGQIWINLDGVMQVFRNGQWQKQHLDISQMDEDLAKTITTIQQNIGNIADDSKLNIKDRRIINDEVSAIIGEVPSKKTGNVYANSLPDYTRLDSNGVGTFAYTRKTARDVEVDTSATAYVNLQNKYTALNTYLSSMTPKPWDVTEANEAMVVDVPDPDEYRQRWLEYYLAEAELVGYTELIAKQKTDQKIENIELTPGPPGVGIKDVVNYYLASANGTSVSTTDQGWTETVQTTDATKRYLWNYEKIIYTNNDTQVTEPAIIGTYGQSGKDGSDGTDGRSIASITEHYLATSASSGVTRSTSGWTETVQFISSSKKYLWNYEKITYKNPAGTEYTDPVIIGVYGDKGQDAPLVKLHGATQIIKVSEDGTHTPSSNFTVTGSTVSTVITRWEYSVNGGGFTTTAPTGVSRSGNTVTVNPTASTFRTLSIRATDGDVTDTFTIARAVDGKSGKDGKDGSTGSDGKDGKDAYTVLLTNESHTFAGSDTSALAGTTSTEILAYKGTSRIPTTVKGVTGLPTGMTYTISGNGTTGNKVTFNVTSSMKTLDGDITISLTVDGQSMEKVFSYALTLRGKDGKDGARGADAVVGFLDNDNHTIPTDKDGNNGNYAGAHSSLVIFNGNKEDTSNWNIRMSATSGVTGTISGNTYTVTNMTTDTGEVEFIATRSGYSDIRKVFTLTKSKQGDSAVLYMLELGSQIIQRNGDTKAMTPDGFTVTGHKKTGESVDLESAKGYFVIYEQSRESMTVDEFTSLALNNDVNQSTEYVLSNSAYPYVLRYKSLAPESTVDYSIQSDALSIRIDWYKDEDHTILLDREIVPVVTDGKTGKDGKGVKDTKVTYQVHTSGTSAPTGTWSTTVPSVPQGRYLWTRTVTTYTDNTSVTTYSVSYNATDGQKGADGTGVASTEVRYQQSTSGNTVPTGSWLSSIPTPVKGRYLWTRTVTRYTDGTSSTSYSTSYYATDGKDGAPGKDGVDGKDGVSITKVDVMYYLSTSSTSLSGGSWQTTPPTWIDGRYMWTKTVTNYSDGTKTETDPVNVTGGTGPSGKDGSNGSDGKDGRSVSNLEEQYYLSTSKTSRSGGSWTTTRPNWEPGKYIWTRIKITYSNPSGTAYTDPVVDASWEAIDNLKIDNRNLIYRDAINIVSSTVNLDSYRSSGYLEIDVSGNFGGVQITPHRLVEPGHYVMSYKYQKLSGTLDAFGGHTDSTWSNNTAYVDGKRVGSYSGTSSVFVADDEEIHEVVVHIEIPSSIDETDKIYIQPNRGSSTPVKVAIYDWKLEKGNNPTTWTPAPEDVEQQIIDQAEVVAADFQADIEIAEQSIRSYVTDTFVKSDDYNEFVETVGLDITQTSEALTLQFSKDIEDLSDTLSGNIEEANEYKKYISFDTGDIILGEEGSNSSIMIANDRISFMQGGVEVAFISGQVMQINHGIFVESATIGDHKIETVGDGHTIVRYVPKTD